MNCLTCSIETTNPKFCSRSCAAKHNNKKHPKRVLETRYCTQCNSKIDRRRYTDQFRLCGSCKELLNLKDKTLSEYHELSSVKGKHPSWRNSHIRALNRSWNRPLTKLPCFSCGYAKHVELAHITPITAFPNDTKLSTVNAVENIVQLCRNCHWEFDHGLLVLSN